MLFQWVDHPQLTRRDQLLNVLYDLGMATKDQLVTITGLSVYNINMLLRTVKKKETKKHDYIRVFYTNAVKRGRNFVSYGVYSLDIHGIRYVQAMRGVENSGLREAPQGQRMHYVGINNILCRAIDMFGRSQVKWHSSSDVTDSILLLWNNSQHLPLERKSMIRPDGRLQVHKLDMLVEFDNETEGPRKLEQKYRRYVDLYQKLPELKQPIVWVTISEMRREYLQRNWEALKDLSYPGANRLPEMHFFVEGKDTEWVNRNIYGRADEQNEP